MMPNYKFALQFQVPNIYHVRQEASDLKDEDFVKAAQEYKAQKEQEKLASRASFPTSVEREFESNLIFI